MEAIIDAVETPYRNKSKSELLIFIQNFSYSFI